MNEDRNQAQYPLRQQAGAARAASGRLLEEITLEALQAGELTAADLRIRRETLLAQAEIAAQAGYEQVAANLTRAAELTGVPNDELLLMYEALRPGRATAQVLSALAETLETKYQAPVNAAFVRQAAAVYRERGLLKRTA